MDQSDSQRPGSRDRQPESSTPIYDRLLAEWCEANRSPEHGSPVARGRGGGSAFVPAPRTAVGAGDGR